MIAAYYYINYTTIGKSCILVSFSDPVYRTGGLGMKLPADAHFYVLVERLMLDSKFTTWIYSQELQYYSCTLDFNAALKMICSSFICWIGPCVVGEFTHRGTQKSKFNSCALCCIKNTLQVECLLFLSVMQICSSEEGLWCGWTLSSQGSIFLTIITCT